MRALARSAGTVLGACVVHPRAGIPGGGGLGGVLLGLAQIGDRGGQVGDQRDGDQRGIASDLAGHRQQPGGGSQLVPLPGGRRYPAVAGTRGPIVAVGGAAQVAAAAPVGLTSICP